MKKIGMLVAVEIEAVLKKYGSPLKTEVVSGFEVHQYRLGEDELTVIHSGAGQIAAAAATQLLITAYQVEMIVNFGVVGGLTKEMNLTRTCLVESVVHYDWDVSEIDHTEVGRYSQFDSVRIPTTEEIVQKVRQLHPEMKTVVCASGDKFISSMERRQELHEAYGAEICEMEAAAIVITCRRAGIPHLLIKTVSDSFEGGADEFHNQYLKSADVCLEVTETVIQHCL